ncbi:beta-1,3-galactosyltransferase brn-like [Ostrea edulis]|uniref:beta-1,3-galactosyltransferase brn-like n=1 Tax=Ostrea edulis TaxID=37623 RepID=UPI0024AEB7E1|nr:beta-1,3-galactosyltransferase brn-like [Ostrea edulis]
MQRFLLNVFLTCMFLTCMTIIVITNTVKNNPLLVQSPNTENQPSSVLAITERHYPPQNNTANQTSLQVSTPVPFFSHITYISNPTTICDSFKTYNGTKILMLVKSSPGNFHLRKWIRYKTKSYKDFKDSVKTIFLLGKSDKWDEDILKECEKNGDIIQGSFIDAYRNLTYKTVMGYRWLSEHCADSEFVVFRDDDFKVNFVNLIQQIKSHKNPQSMFMGLLINKGRTIYRDPKHKWYLSKTDYPKSVLPPYFPGGAYLVSTSIARNLSSNFHLVKWLPIDDVYIGLVAQKVGVNLTHSKLFAFKNCDKFSTIMACREFSRPQEVLEAWRAVTVDDLQQTRT